MPKVVRPQSWQHTAGFPAPPDDLSAPARDLWLETVGARAANYFKPGTTELLRTFCETSIAMRKVNADLAALVEPTDDQDDAVERALALPNTVRLAKDLSSIVNATAAKLRISKTG